MIQIEKLVPGGYGLGTDSTGKKGFFWNTLPGEQVIEFDIKKNKSHFFEAIATKLDNLSQHRVEPQDDCFLSTSPWQILDYQYELEQKQAIVEEIFSEHKIIIPTPKIITDGCEYFYRNKMEYTLYWDHYTKKIELAFHQRGSHRKIPISQSSIERPEILRRATDIIHDLNSRGEEARKYQSLLLRCNQKGEVSGGLYEKHHPHPHFSQLTDQILGKTYSYSPNGFFQINLPVYELALKEIKKYIYTDKVLDLYSGVGTISLSVARDKQLILVESDKFAYNELCKNITAFEEPLRRRAATGANEARNDGPEGAFRKSSNIFPQPIYTKSEEALNYIEPDQTVILDPPRAGCDPKLINHLNKIQPETIIYLSCNPATQARDVEALLKNYHILDIKIFNFFPRTPHIENLVILIKSC